jgi:hypothetical protein
MKNQDALHKTKKSIIISQHKAIDPKLIDNKHKLTHIIITKKYLRYPMSLIKLHQHQTNLKFSSSVGIFFSIMFATAILVTSQITRANAQSTDRDVPTNLTTNIISTTGLKSEAKTYFYTFIAKPGELKLTLDIDAGSTNGNGVVSTVSIQDKDGNEFSQFLAGATPGIPGRQVKKIKFAQPTQVILMLTSPQGATANYTSKIKIEGDYQLINIR